MQYGGRPGPRRKAQCVAFLGQHGRSSPLFVYTGRATEPLRIHKITLFFVFRLVRTIGVPTVKQKRIQMENLLK